MAVYLTQEKLAFLSEEEILKLKGSNVIITKCNGDTIQSSIVNVIGASNKPHLSCGFILDNGSEIGFVSIKQIKIVP